MPELYAYIDEKMFKTINKKFETELTFFKELEDIHLIIVASFTLSKTGSLNVDALSMMTVNDKFIPFENSEDLEFVKTLIFKNNYFIKPLRYNMPLSEPLASAIITNGQEKPLAVYHAPADSTPDFLKKIHDFSEANNYEIEVKNQ